MRMKNLMRILALALAAVMILTSCSSSTSSTDESGTAGTDSSATGTTDTSVTEGLTDWVDWQLQSSEPSTFLLLNSEAQAISRIMVNVYSALLEHDSYGVQQPAVAESVEHNDDSTVWTFHLRDDVVWTDSTGEERAQCTAQDWVTAMEWIMNYWKNEGHNTSMPSLMIKGAEEYYEYTKELTEEEALALTSDGVFSEMVGVEAPDDTTLIYTCPSSCPYFQTLAACACLYPMSQANIDEIGVENLLSADPSEFWSNGCYFVTEYVQNNSVVLEQNPNYWDTDCTRFNSITIKFIEDATKDDLLIETGEVDVCTPSSSTLKLVSSDESNQFYDNLVQIRDVVANQCIYFNWNKNLEDGETPDDNWNTAIRNEAFRLSLYWGLDLTEYWSIYNNIDPESLATQNFTTEGVAVFSDGTDYTKRVREITGVEGVRYDAEKGEAYKQQAIEELTAQGVTFPIEIDFYVAGGNQTSLDTANTWKTIFEECLGTDYIDFQIKTYVSSSSEEVMIPSKGSFYTAGWIADYGDPENFLSCIWADGTGSFATYMEHVNDEDIELCDEFATFTEMAKEGAAIVDDLDNRYEALAQAEAYAFEHALIIPVLSNEPYNITKMNTYSGPYSTYGIQSDLMKNKETSTEFYTTEEYEQLIEEYNAGKGE